MSMPTSISESTRRLNPHLFGHGVAKAATCKQGLKVQGPQIRQKQGDGMNKTERAFLAYLRASYPNGYIHREVSLPLANGCRYRVDFLAVHTGQTGPIIHGYEVKGFMRDDAAVKLKVAASVYPWIKFFLVSRQSQKTTWALQEVRT